MESKYTITATKEVQVNGEWFVRTVVFEIEASSETDAEWEVRKAGYSPIVTCL